MTPERVDCPSARVLLLDEADRVLLFRGFDPHRPDQPFRWTPGGGVHDGESLGFDDVDMRSVDTHRWWTPPPAPPWELGV